MCNIKDFDRTLVLDDRTKLVAENHRYVMRIAGNDKEG